MKSKKENYFKLLDSIKEYYRRKMKALKIVFPEWKTYKRKKKSGGGE